MSFRENSILTFFLVLLFFLSCNNSLAAIYTFVDEDGVVHFTNIKPRNREFKVLIPEAYPSRARSQELKSRENYDSLIRFYSKKYNVDPLLVKAVIMAESNFEPQAVSRKGAMGLMQLMPETARMLNIQDAFDPEENIKGGTLYLRILKDYFNEDLDLVLAAYNAGPKRVIESRMNVPPIEETIQYIKRVKFFYRKLKALNES
ncbi:MAG: transglycosylase SLT domain-containing protein [Deltaproteobacteria bacterium]|nr:transglycosylase SLT domain-containing protein [Deltaproteobacteria bacterium]